MNSPRDTVGPRISESASHIHRSRNQLSISSSCVRRRISRQPRIVPLFVVAVKPAFEIRCRAFLRPDSRWAAPSRCRRSTCARRVSGELLYCNRFGRPVQGGRRTSVRRNRLSSVNRFRRLPRVQTHPRGNGRTTLRRPDGRRAAPARRGRRPRGGPDTTKALRRGSAASPGSRTVFASGKKTGAAGGRPRRVLRLGLEPRTY